MHSDWKGTYGSRLQKGDSERGKRMGAPRGHCASIDREAW